MSNFSFTTDKTEEIWKCTSCTYCSTKKHLPDTNSCPLCKSDVKMLETKEKQTGMPAYQYQEYLTHIEENANGVGSSTVASIKEEFDGEEFIDATKKAYNDGKLDELTCVSGVGQATAKNIAIAIAEKKGFDTDSSENGFVIRGLV